VKSQNISQCVVNQHEFSQILCQHGFSQQILSNCLKASRRVWWSTVNRGTDGDFNAAVGSDLVSSDPSLTLFLGSSSCIRLSTVVSSMVSYTVSMNSVSQREVSQSVSHPTGSQSSESQSAMSQLVIQQSQSAVIQYQEVCQWGVRGSQWIGSQSTWNHTVRKQSQFAVSESEGVRNKSVGIISQYDQSARSLGVIQQRVSH